MMISGMTPYSGYQVLGIYGNPTSVNPINRISEDTRKSNPLVTVSEEPEQLTWEDMNLPRTAGTAVSSFSVIMKKQELTGAGTEWDESSDAQQSAVTADVLNETIGLMGYQNALRESLMGTGFQEF